MDFVIELLYGNFDEATRKAVAKVEEFNRVGPLRKSQLEFVKLRVHVVSQFSLPNIKLENKYEYHWRLT